VEALVVEEQDVIVLIMIHHLVEVMEVIVISEEIVVLVVVEVDHGIVMVDMVEVVVEEDLQELIILVLVYRDKAMLEEIVQINGVVLVVEEKVDKVDKWRKVVVEGVYVMIFQVRDSLNTVHKQEEELVEQTGIFSFPHIPVENMVVMEVEVEVHIAVILQEVTRTRPLIEDKELVAKVIAHAEDQEMEVRVLFK
jgi:hypothetical protein